MDEPERRRIVAEINRLTALIDKSTEKLLELRRELAAREEDVTLLKQRYGRTFTATWHLLKTSLDETDRLRRPQFDEEPEG